MGKSSLVEFLCEHFGFKPFYEPNDLNPYLDDFYKNMKKWAFHSQMHFLSHKFRLHQQLAKEKNAVVQDRSIYEDAEIFATNLHRQKLMSDRDFTTYYEMYQTILKSLRPPDLLIYLDCPVSVIRKRIKSRGRKSELDMPTAYLRQLNTLYEEWIERFDLAPVIRISTERMDYVTNLLDRVDLMAIIDKYQ